jgi:cyclopropane fatty-acyl-phospholipid synthase-like methyltransferase/ABC-type nitrate/sulfonate/bicarbonate transport system substrate-binding protein
VRDGIFLSKGVEVEFKEVPEGTGKMCAGLRDGSFDVAVLLTEGIVKDIAQGNPSLLIATYVDSPLTWAVVTGPQSPTNSIDELKGKIIGISRFGSGSHLMSFVMADQKGWNVEAGDLTFAVNNDFAGLRTGVQSGATNAFMWETFMTKPYVDRKELKKIGEVVTPWPCFMIAARTEVAEKRWSDLEKMLAGIEEACQKFKQGGEASVQHLSAKFGLTVEDAAKWFAGVRYSAHGAISRRVLVRTVDTLIRAKILPPYEPKFSFSRFYDPRATLADVDSEEVRTIKLFYDLRLKNELVARGKDTGPITVPELMNLDQLHYFGHEAVDHAARVGGFDSSKRILEIGSGLGGPARYMAWKYGCKVEAVEIEEKRHAMAVELTARTGLSHMVHHSNCDIMTFSSDAPFDVIVSWLSICHIRDREALFKKCFSLLKPGGLLLVEDLCAAAPLTSRELSDLQIAVAMPLCPSHSDYVASVKAGGFTDVKVEDLTQSWNQFVQERINGHEKNHDSLVLLHGEEVVIGLGYFFGIISNIFKAGHLGGLRIVVRKSD